MGMIEAKKKLLNYAYRLLARREYSVSDLRQKLLKWCDRWSEEFSFDRSEILDLITVVLQDLQANNYVSDERFTRLFIEQKQLIQGWGRQKIWHSLRQKGVDESVFIVLWEARESDAISDKIKSDVQKKWINLAKKQKSQTEVFQALMRFLAGRGFGYAQSQKILEAVKLDQQTDV